MNKVEHYVDEFGNERWMFNGELHRTGGPAVSRADGFRVWIQHSNFHRTDGPAIIRADGTISWWLHDRRYSFDDYCAILDLTPEQILELKLKYG